MGIRTDPGYRLYTGNSFCFPIGKTPKKLYITFRGIEKTSSWVAGMHEPQNKTFIVESTDVGRWQKLDGNPNIFVFFNSVVSFVFMNFAGEPDMYYTQPQVPCLFSGENDLYLDDWPFKNGIHVICTRD